MHLITSATICPLPLHCLMAIIMGFAFPVSMAEMTLVFSVNQIVKGKSLVNLSQEELESLNEALGERTNEEALASVIHSQ